jgi:ring-1,2-phenylacetyl-CoA epoxidase subunit PaaC
MNQLAEALKRPVADLLLSVADDKFILGHRNADWTGLAPILEEDIAFSSLAQDELAHASALYQLAAGLRNTTADRLAFGRRPEEYRCAQIMELSDQFDWSMALARNFFCDHFDAVRLHRLAQSAYVPLAQLASRLVAEEQIHVDHVDSWMHRLGRGSEEARARMVEAVNRLAPQAAQLWELPEDMDPVRAEGILPGDETALFLQWANTLRQVAEEAGMKLNLPPYDPATRGGRRGQHSSGFAPLLDELTEVYRLEPEAAW